MGLPLNNKLINRDNSTRIKAMRVCKANKKNQKTIYKNK